MSAVSAGIPGGTFAVIDINTGFPTTITSTNAPAVVSQGGAIVTLNGLPFMITRLAMAPWPCGPWRSSEGVCFLIFAGRARDDRQNGVGANGIQSTGTGALISAAALNATSPINININSAFANGAVAEMGGQVVLTGPVDITTTGFNQSNALSSGGTGSLATASNFTFKTLGTGDNNFGASANFGGTIRLNNGSISIGNSAYSYGIFAGNSGVLTNPGSQLTATNVNIETIGPNAYAVVTNDRGQINFTGGSIETTGASGVGIQAYATSVAADAAGITAGPSKVVCNTPGTRDSYIRLGSEKDEGSAPWQQRKGRRERLRRPRLRRRRKHPRRTPARKVAVTGQSLRLAARQGDVRVRRAGEAYVEKATELEAARIERAEAERALAAFYAAEAAREKRPFFNFLAQGDSWFDDTCGFAIIHWLQALFKPKNAYFKNIADSGRTLRQMLSSDFKDELAAGPPGGARWSGILLSGGGNDICGDHRFRDWLKPNGGGAHPPDYYITPAFDHELGILKGIYEEAIALVGSVTPGVRLFVHDYDFAIPDGRCVTGRSPHLRADFRICFAGPWMWPAFEERGFHKPGDRVPQLTKDIVTMILKRFADMLVGLAKKYPNQLVLVRTQGTLKPPQDAKLWVNELHPYDDSFALLAKPFYDKLRSLL